MIRVNLLGTQEPGGAGPLAEPFGGGDASEKKGHRFRYCDSRDRCRRHRFPMARLQTRTFERQLGVQWGFTSNQTQELGNTTELTFPNRVQFDGQAIGSNSAQQFTASTAGGGLFPPTFLEGASTVQRGYAVNLPFAGSPTGAVGLSLGSITGAFSIDAAISAAERRGQVRVISAPKIITQNNQTAEIKQGTTFPVQVVANNTITVQFKEAILELNVTPQITSASTIILDIEINNDIPDFSRPVNGIPSIRTQSATTQVLMADGKTTVIGGVFVNTQTTAEQYVPLLSQDPDPWLSVQSYGKRKHERGTSDFPDASYSERRGLGGESNEAYDTNGFLEEPFASFFSRALAAQRVHGERRQRHDEYFRRHRQHGVYRR